MKTVSQIFERVGKESQLKGVTGDDVPLYTDKSADNMQKDAPVKAYKSNTIPGCLRNSAAWDVQNNINTLQLQCLGMIQIPWPLKFCNLGLQKQQTSKDHPQLKFPFHSTTPPKQFSSIRKAVQTLNYLKEQVRFFLGSFTERKL